MLYDTLIFFVDKEACIYILLHLATFGMHTYPMHRLIQFFSVVSPATFNCQNLKNSNSCEILI